MSRRPTSTIALLGEPRRRPGRGSDVRRAARLRRSPACRLAATPERRRIGDKEEEDASDDPSSPAVRPIGAAARGPRAARRDAGARPSARNTRRRTSPASEVLAPPVTVTPFIQPFDLDAARRMSVKVMVEGRPFSFLVDTGAERMVIARSPRQRLGLVEGANLGVATIGGSSGSELRDRHAANVRPAIWRPMTRPLSGRLSVPPA